MGGMQAPDEPEATPKLVLQGAREHNLKNLDRRVPAAAPDVCVTGVSGSGKSTLVQDILAPALGCATFGKASEGRPARTTELLGMPSG